MRHVIESPFLKLLGARLEEWSDGYARVSLDIAPQLLNRSGVLQGGVLATLLDHVGGLCGLYCAEPANRRYGVTLSMTCNFIGQTKSGRVQAMGKRTSAGRKIFFAASEVRAEAGQLLATGTSVVKFRTGSEAPEGVEARAEASL